MELLAGDILLIERRSALGALVGWFESEDPEAIPKWTHAAIVKDRDGNLFESVWPAIGMGKTSEYAGAPAIVGRFTGRPARDFDAAFGRVYKHAGESYPWYRLALDALHLGRKVKTAIPVCSELAVEFLFWFTGLACFSNPEGWTPAELAFLFEYGKEFEIAFKGVLS